MTYANLLRTYPRQLAYGLLHTLASGWGQTYLVALFVSQICDYYAISRTYYSSMYAAATVVSAILLPFTGSLIDRWNLRTYSVTVALVLGLATILKGLAEHFALFFIALTLTRHCGQALMTHISATAVARYFGQARGKALALANVGFPLAEASLPLIIAWSFGHYSWRTVFIVMGLVLLFIFIPLTNMLLPRGSDFSDPRPLAVDKDVRQYSRSEVLRSPFIYLILPVALMAPFVFTGLIFHQDVMAVDKGWTLQWVAGSFAVFAATRVTGSFVMGPLVDRFTARRIMPFYMLPFCIGGSAIFFGDSKWLVALVWGGAGLTTGFGSNLKQAIWAEVYGTKHLGAIRSMLTPLAVLATALAPPVFAWGLDLGWSFEQVLVGAMVAVLVSSVIAGLTLIPKFRP